MRQAPKAEWKWLAGFGLLLLIGVGWLLTAPSETAPMAPAEPDRRVPHTVDETLDVPFAGALARRPAPPLRRARPPASRLALRVVDARTGMPVGGAVVRRADWTAAAAAGCGLRPGQAWRVAMTAGVVRTSDAAGLVALPTPPGPWVVAVTARAPDGRALFGSARYSGLGPFGLRELALHRDTTLRVVLFDRDGRPCERARLALVALRGAVVQQTWIRTTDNTGRAVFAHTQTLGRRSGTSFQLRMACATMTAVLADVDVATATSLRLTLPLYGRVVVRLDGVAAAGHIQLTGDPPAGAAAVRVARFDLTGSGAEVVFEPVALGRELALVAHSGRGTACAATFAGPQQPGATVDATLQFGPAAGGPGVAVRHGAR